jgi:NADP-dependent 3-hydroxy acid dehydrogenase YdfG
MIDWTTIVDHAIAAICGALTTTLLTAIPAYFAFKVAMRKLDENTVQTVKGKNASVAAVRQGAVNESKLDDIKDAQGTPTVINVEKAEVKVESPVVEPPPVPFH